MNQKSKSLVIIAFLFIGAIVSVAFFKPQQQPQKLTATMFISEWQEVMNVINNPDDFSPNQRKEISNNLTRNLVAADTTKPKK